MTLSVPKLTVDVAVQLWEQMPETRRNRDPSEIVRGLCSATGIDLVEGYALLDALERAQVLLEQAEVGSVEEALELVGIISP